MDPRQATALLKEMILEASSGTYAGVKPQLDDHFACPSALSACSERKMTAAAQDISSVTRQTQSLSLSPSPLDFAKTKLNVHWDSWAKRGFFTEIVPQLYYTSSRSFSAELQRLKYQLPSSMYKRNLLVGIRVDGTGSSTRWYEANRMIDETSKRGLGSAIWYSRGVLGLYNRQFQQKWGLAPGEGQPCNGVSGTCIDTSKTKCPRTTIRGKCPGSSKIVCCPSSSPAPAPPGYTDGEGNPCADFLGICIDRSKTRCPRATIAGKCAGGSNIVCCPSSSPGVGAPCGGPSAGFAGTCIDTSKSRCPRGTLTGQCPGGPSIKCCPYASRVEVPEGPACTNYGGTCIDTSKTVCPSRTISGKCPGGSNIRCCPSRWPCGAPSAGFVGTCIDTRRSSCRRGTLAGQCVGSSSFKCCPHGSTANGPGSPCSFGWTANGTCIDTSVDSCHTATYSDKCHGGLACCPPFPPP